MSYNDPWMWPLEEKDKIFGDLVESKFVSFAFNSSVPAWKPINDIPQFPSDYVVTMFSNQENISISPKKEKCAFWKKNGFDYELWQN